MALEGLQIGFLLAPRAPYGVVELLAELCIVSIDLSKLCLELIDPCFELCDDLPEFPAEFRGKGPGSEAGLVPRGGMGP